jgi:serine/threonine protein kinase
MKLCPTCGAQYDDATERCANDETALIRVKTTAAEREQAMIGRTLDRRYVIESKLGQGGMGTVYIAQQVAVGRRVAIKLLPPAIADDLAAVKRFMQEAKAASTLSHPNAITIHDFGQLEDGLLFLVMELVEGQTLASALKAARTLPVERAVRICAQILSALEDAHARGIVHRDLKPDNVIVSPRPGNPDFVKVLDFGLAKVADDGSHENLTQTGQVFGTPAYMSPEQALGERCDLRTDLYAVGVMLYEMVGGRRPFEGESPVSILVKHISSAPPPLAGPNPGVALPAALVEATQKALAKPREERFQSAAEMRAVLEAAIASPVGVSTAPPPRAGLGDAETLAPDSVAPAAVRRATNLGIAETLAPDSLPPSAVRSAASLAPVAPLAAPSVPSGFLGQVSAASLPPPVAASMPSAPPSRPERSPARLAAVVAVLGLAGGGAYFALQGAPPEPAVTTAAAQPAPVQAPSAAPSAAEAPRSARLQVEATPAAAQAEVRVVVGGRAEPVRLLGTLPGAVEVPLGAQVTLAFSAPGHQSVERALVVDGPVSVSVALPSAPPPTAPQPAQPTAAPSVAASPPRPSPPATQAPTPPAPRPAPTPKPAAPVTTAPAAGLDDLK